MTYQEKLDAIIAFFKTYNTFIPTMLEEWKSYRDYYVQAYIWGWQDQDFKGMLKEISWLVPGWPLTLVKRLEADTLSEKHRDGIVKMMYDDITQGNRFRGWRLALESKNN